MANELTLPKTLQEAIILFSDPLVCHNYMAAWRWKGGVVCPLCGSSEVGGLVKSRLVWNCKGCKQQFSVTVGKTIVMDVLERSEEEVSQVRAKVIQDTSKKTLHAEIRREVSAFSELYTDAWKGYRGLSPEYIHKFVAHAVNYAIGQVHTNGLENFWSLLKRCLKGTYISVEPFHLFRYLDEQVFRFNNRAYNDGDRLNMVAGSVSGKRITYADLTKSYEAYYNEVLPKVVSR